MKKILTLAAMFVLAFAGCSIISNVSKVEITPTSATLAPGGTQQFTAKAFDSSNSELSDVTFTWESSDNAIATINTSGLATAVAVGTCTITVKSGGKQATATLTVRSGAAVTSIEISPSTATISVQGTKQFTAKALDASDNEITGVVFAWSSSDTSVAKINSSGLATGYAKGSISIIAAAEGKADTATLVVGGGPTYHDNGTISSDEVWEPAGNPHVIRTGISVEGNATLTIKPGCIVKFEPNTELYCGWETTSGAIVAEGTADSTITFTSNATTPSKGDWRSIGVYTNAMSTTSFKYCIVEYGGKIADDGEFTISGVGTKLSHCTIRKSLSYGISLKERDLISGNFTTFDNNVITECDGNPLHISDPDRVRTIGTGNTFTGNAQNAILVGEGKVATSCTWANPGIPYQIAGEIYVEDASNSPVLTIAPGNTLKFQSGGGLYVGYNEIPGGLIADGTSGLITFTSATNPPSKGNWGAIGFYDQSIDAMCKIKNCKIEYGGYFNDGNVIISDALPEVTGDSIGHGKAYGIYVMGSEYPDTTALRTSNIFYDNTEGDVNSP